MFATDVLTSISNTPVMQSEEKTLMNNTSTDVITSALFSSFRSVTPVEELVKGSTIHIAIEARDQDQQPMLSGGDFWFAVMSTNQPHQASTSGKIVDYNNGTYSAYFYAAWSGNAEINITLVHPSKAVYFLHNTYWNKGPRVFWSATFENMTTRTELERTNTFDTVCWIKARNINGTFLCEYPSASESSALGSYVLVCEPPEDKVCRPLDMIAMHKERTIGATNHTAKDYIKYFQR